MNAVIRPGESRDVSEVIAIQDASEQLSAWSPEALGHVLEGGSDYDLLVAESDGRVVAFLLWRELPADEMEVLSLAVDPSFRRRGLGRELMRNLLENRSGTCFLEVRESNLAARALYRSCGFEESGSRPAYYHRPVENAVLMRRSERWPKGATGPY